MGILRALNLRSPQNVYEAARLHEGDINKLGMLARDYDGEITHVRPYRKSDGIRRAEDLIATFHDPTAEQNWLENLLGTGDGTDEYSFELWFSTLDESQTEKKLRFMIKTPDEDEQSEIHKEINSLYPNARIYDSNRHMPDFDSGQHIAGGEFTLKNTKYAPLRSFSGPDAFEKQKEEAGDEKGTFLVDVYKNILGQLIGHQNQTILYQITFRAAPFDWTDGYGPFDPSAERVAEFLEEGRFVDSWFNPRIIDPTEKDKETAKHIENLEEIQAFEINIRYFATGESPNKAVRKVEGIENSVIANYQNNKVAQQLEATRYGAETVKEKLRDAAKRKVERNDFIVTKSELAALAHLPNDTIDKSNVDFVQTAIGGKAPGSASQTKKDGLIDDKASQRQDSTFIEAENSPAPSAENVTDEEATSLTDRIKQAFNNNQGEAYYRSDATADSYAETSVTAAMPDEAKDDFLKFCAAYERDELDVEKLKQDVGSEQRANRLINKFETHIEESHIKLAEQQESNSDGQENIDTPQLPEGEQDKLPVTQDQSNQSSSTSTSGHAESTVRGKQHLPETMGKHPISVVDKQYKQTRTESGDLLTMTYAEFAKERNDDEPEMYMGEDLRKLLIEDHRDNPKNDIWIGYQETGDNPFREIGIPDESWFKHISIFGGTGLGKSTEIKNMINQVARKEYGMVVIDPKGDMAQELMRELPESRIENDVIWIEPGSIDNDRIAAINFLEASVPKDHARYDREVESIVSDLQAVLRAGEYWGPKMAGITKNITRAMVRSENPYTLYDMYNVLINQEKRWNFARSLQREDVDLGTNGDNEISEDIKQYSKRIAQMDEEEVDPVVRRLQDWAESPISKEIVSHRYSSVNIDKAVNEGKIILLKNSVEDREIKRVISTAIMRRVWVAIQARAEVEREKDREPFFAFIDEFDDVVSDDMEIDKMLSKARSGKMSVTLACQNPAQIKDDYPKILKQIFANTSTMMSFGITEPGDARLIADRMGEKFEPNDLLKMEQYRVATKITHTGEYGPKQTEPLALETIPDYPPVRTEQQAKEAISKSLDKFGVEPMENHPGETDLLISGGGLQEQVVANFLELVWNEQHRSRSDTINVATIANRFERKTGEAISDYPKGLGIPKEMIEVHNVAFEDEDETDSGFNTTTDTQSGAEVITDGQGAYATEEVDLEDTSASQKDKIAFKTDSRIYIQQPTAEVSITGAGIEAVLKQDSGRSQPTANHREIIKEIFRWFSRLGFHTAVPVQTGENEVCDTQANLPINDNLSISEIKDAVEQFEKEHELAAKISHSSNLNIEAEGTTHRKPARTIENVLRAYKDGKRAMLVVKDGRADGHRKTYNANLIEKILTEPPYYREDRLVPPGVDPDTVDDDAEPVRHLYNKAAKLNVGKPDDSQEKFALLPKGSQTVWIDIDGQLFLFDGVGPDATKQGEIEYTETEYASSNAMEIWCRYDEYQEEWVVYPGQDEQFRYETKQELEQEWQFVYQPLYMPQEVDTLPEKDDWEIIILPDVDAINRQTGDPEEESQVEKDDSESYEYDRYFPKEEVPLIYNDGKTEPLIPHDKDEMFTPRRDEDTTDETESDDDDSTLNATPEELMNSFEQIKLEEETKEIIDGYQKPESKEELNRLNELDGIYGAKNPGEIDFWKTIWDEYNIEYDHGIPESYIPKAAIGALGLSPNKADDIVDIGREFALLVEAEPEEVVNLDYIEDDTDETILRVVLPEERPDLYLDNPKQYAERETWAEVWESSFGDTNVIIKQNTLGTGAKTTLNIETEAEIRAAIEVGQMSQAINESDSGFSLASERPKEYWLDVWETAEVPIGKLASRSEIEFAVGAKTGNIGKAKKIVSEAIESGELYSPADAPDDHYTINDPATDDGPEINKDTSSDDDDDDDDGTSGDGQQHDSGDDPGDTPTGQTQTQDTQTEPATASANADNATTPDSQTASTNGAEPETTVDTQTADADAGDTSKECEEGEASTSPSESKSDGDPEPEDNATVIRPESAQNGSDSANDQSNTEPSPEPESAQTTEQSAATSQQSGETDSTSTSTQTDSDTDPATQPQSTAADTTSSEDESSNAGTDTTTESQSDPTPTEEEIEAYIQSNNLNHRIEAEVALNPPPEPRVKAAMAAVVEFCHQQIDTEIPENKEWNENNPDAPYRRPETAREYFQDPQYDSDSTPPTEFNPKTELLTNSDGPTEYEISTEASDKITTTTQLEQDDSDTSSDDSDETEVIVPYNYKSRDNRGWSPETIAEKKLGWAPRDNRSIREHLIDEGFTKKEMMATGLFNITDDGTLLPRIQCRYVFPYFNGDGEPVFLTSRSIDTDIPQDEGPDYFSPAKYLKPRNSTLPEPIYGTQTIEPNEPLVITEGIADAISAHEHGIPCISPVTTQFKEQHYSVLYNLITENNIPQVFIIQDADPPNSSAAERFKSGYHESYNPDDDDSGRPPESVKALSDALTVNQQGPGFDGALKTAQYLREKAQTAADGSSTQQHTTEGDSNKTDSEGDSEAEISPSLARRADPSQIDLDMERDKIDIEEDDIIKYPELYGHETPDLAFETYIVNLPRLGDIKYDLDDYLSDGMAQIAPPAFWVSDIIDRPTPTGRWISELERKDELQLVDPKEYTGDHAIGEVVSASGSEGDADSEDGDDTDNETTTRIVMSPLSARATTLNYLPTLNGGDAALGVDLGDDDTKKPSMDGSRFNGSSTDVDMWDLTLFDLYGIDGDYRGKSPIEHTGKSEDYFVSISESHAFDYKRQSTFTPSTAVLVEEGERYARDPEGSLSDWETFVYWRYLREKGIVSDNPPNKALLAYAKREGIASSDDGIVTRDGQYGEFDALTKEALYQTLDKIEARYDIDITFDPFGDRDNESDTNGSGSEQDQAGSSGSEGGSTKSQTQTQSSASTGEGQSGSATNDDATSSAESATENAASLRAQSGSESSAGSSASGESVSGEPATESSTTDGSQPVTNNPDQSAESASSDTNSAGATSNSSSAGESGSNTSDIQSTSQETQTNSAGATPTGNTAESPGDSSEPPADDDEVDPIKQRHEANRESPDELETATHPEGGVPISEVNEEMNKKNSDDQHNTFKTYTEPDADEGEYDPDREAVKQFVDEFCVVEPNNKEEVKMAKDEMFNALIKWIEINGAEVDDLSEDVYITQRKGNLKNILIDEYDIEAKQFRIDGEIIRGFRGMDLSDNAEVLLTMDVD